MTRTRGEGRGDSEKAQVVVTPLSVLRAQAARRKAEEEAWAARNGPVETRYVDAETARIAGECLAILGGCQECGNEDATVVIASGEKVCTDCAQKLDP